MIKKLIRNGSVAVLYSPGFGAGWSTWSSRNGEAMVFDRDIAEAIEKDDRTLAKALAESKWPDEYFGGLDSLVIKWVP